jgi:oxygen-dependent protoporphyrinogen oxidase
MSGAHKNFVVIGAGISGLVCAYRLKVLGADVFLLERAWRVGGVICSESVDGFLIERGPNSARGTREFLELVGELGLADQLLRGDRRAPAFVYFGGQLHRVPMGPGALLRSRLLSARGKLRLLAEPFISKREIPGEESVASFFGRRLGAEVAHRLVAPFVSGIYAGDAEQLSVQAAFPQMAELEAGYGSLFRGMLGRTPTQSERLCSFQSGMASLPRALAARLEGGLALGCENLRLARRSPAGFELSFDGGRLTCDQIVVAVPAYEAARLIAPISPELGGLLAQIEYSPLAVIHLAYDESSIGAQLNGFGFLVAPRELLRVLGCIYSSKIFERRAPQGKVLLTVFVGGALDPGAIRLSDDELIMMAHSDLQKAFGIAQKPRPIAITRYDRAIPQYNLGHLDRVRRIEELMGRAGIWLIGNYLRGVSVGDCIREADRAARSLLSAAAGVL